MLSEEYYALRKQNMINMTFRHFTVSVSKTKKE